MFLLRRADSKANPKGQYDTSLDQELRDRVEAELAKEVPLSIKDLEVGGRDVMEALGIDEGPRVGEALSHLLEVVLEDPEKNERSILLEEMRTWGQNLK
jgi:hypothetical protein